MPQLIARGGRDTPDKLRTHAQRTARAWSLDGHPLLGISVFAVLDMPLDELLSRRFATFRTIHLLTVGQLASAGSSYSLRDSALITQSASSKLELKRLLDALGAAQPNPQYARSTMIWRGEG